MDGTRFAIDATRVAMDTTRVVMDARRVAMAVIRMDALREKRWIHCELQHKAISVNFGTIK